MSYCLTEGQYRCLVAYLSFWTRLNPKLSIDQAIKDIGIFASKDDVIDALFKTGHTWSNKLNKLVLDDGLVEYAGDEMWASDCIERLVKRVEELEAEIIALNERCTSIDRGPQE